MVKKRTWGVVAMVLAAAMILPLAADARMPMSAEEIAAACIEEMEQISEDTHIQLMTVTNDLVFELENFPEGATIPQAFKLTATESAKIDKLVASGISRIEKVGTKCIAKLIRMDADSFIQGDVATVRSESTQALRDVQDLAQDYGLATLQTLIDG